MVSCISGGIAELRVVFSMFDMLGCGYSEVVGKVRLLVLGGWICFWSAKVRCCMRRWMVYTVDMLNGIMGREVVCGLVKLKGLYIPVGVEVEVVVVEVVLCNGVAFLEELKGIHT